MNGRKYNQQISLRDHQRDAIKNKKDKKKCLINMWCGTGKTVTFTCSIFEDNKSLNVIVFPSLGLINQYSNDYFLNENEMFQPNSIVKVVVKKYFL